MYRVRRKLSLGGGKYIPRGIQSELKELTPQNLRRLLELGYVTRVETPPLAILPRFKRRSESLRTMGIISIEDLLRADSDDVADNLDLKVDTIEKWKREAEDYLSLKKHGR